MNYLINISLDSNLKFQYTDVFTKASAANLAIRNNDLIIWTLDPSIEERALQVDFGAINPFHIFRNVSLRGQGQVSSDQVNFPNTYPGNRQIKYTVSLGSGFVDDPYVVPVENTPTLMVHTLALAANFAIDWVVGNIPYQAIVLANPNVAVQSVNGKANVTWQWSVNAGDPTPPFTLDFINPPAGWPTSTIDSTDPDGGITLSLPPGGNTQFKITTTSGDAANPDVHVYGYLTVN